RHRQQHHRREHTQADQPATLASELTPHRRGRRPPPLPHRRGHDSRTLGSNTRYNSSASRFITSTEDANTTNTPCSSGRSGPRNASYVNNPSPGHENTVSTVTVPDTTMPNCKNTNVTVGSNAFGTACRRRTRSSRSPFARAVVR